MTESLKIKWACPKCGAPHEGHGEGECKDRHAHQGHCQGFICDCDDMASGPDHGETFADPCPNACCYHCDWHGVFPKKPKGLQAWEKKALDAGWSPPDERKKELGLS